MDGPDANAGVLLDRDAEVVGVLDQRYVAALGQAQGEGLCGCAGVPGLPAAVAWTG